MPRAFASLVASSTLALAVVANASPDVSGLVNARLRARSAAAGLEPEVRTLLSTEAGPFWMGYVVPASGKHSMCCWTSGHDSETTCGGCRLEGVKGEGAFRLEQSKPLSLERAPRLRVLLRGEGGRVNRVRTVSEDCALDAGGLPFVWIESVRPADSVAYLSTLAGAAREGKDLEDSVLAAIAFHDADAADVALARFVDQDQPDHRRRQAAFWMGQARRARGLEQLMRLVSTDPSPRFREHVVFALSQSQEPRAIDRIIEVARNDPSAHVRGQALFWLAQTASRRAPEALQAAVSDDPEIEVKKKAVFALSQLPRDEGVPLLIRLARTHKNTEVRKQAMFWLGQSGDPRALQFFADVLKP